MKPLRPNYFFGHDKRFADYWEFKQKSWNLHGVFSKDTSDGKAKKWALAAVTDADRAWVWTLPVN